MCTVFFQININIKIEKIAGHSNICSKCFLDFWCIMENQIFWKGCFDTEKLRKHCAFKTKYFIFQNKLVSKDQSVQTEEWNILMRLGCNTFPGHLLLDLECFCLLGFPSSPVYHRPGQVQCQELGSGDRTTSVHDHFMLQNLIAIDGYWSKPIKILF